MPILSPSHDPSSLERAAARLRRGELVAFPTETVYGLGANALDATAVARIFAAKGRPANNPLIVHVGSIPAALRVVSSWPETAQVLAEAFWPGPLTLVLPKRPEVPDAVTAGLDTVGVRIPAHPIAQRLLAAAGLPLAAPSANRYTGISPTRAEHVARALGNELWVLDGGPTDVGLESTVLSLCGVPRILRPGGIGHDQLRLYLPDLPPFRPQIVEDHAAPSPGLARRHYAPRTRVVLGLPESFAPDEAVIALGESTGHSNEIVLPRDPVDYARGLYAALHALDSTACTTLYIQPVPESPGWDAVRDRLSRATA